MREEGVHTQRNGVLKGVCMQRNKKAGVGSLGAALVACLSMEHITTGFNSQRWKNHVPKAGQQRWGRLRGGGRKVAVAMVVEGGEIAVKTACMWCSVGDGEFDDGAGTGRQPFIGPESLGPE